jgi:hypothetical protein
MTWCGTRYIRYTLNFFREDRWQFGAMDVFFGKFVDSALDVPQLRCSCYVRIRRLTRYPVNIERELTVAPEPRIDSFAVQVSEFEQFSPIAV